MRHRICLNGEWDFAPHYNYCQPPRDVADNNSWEAVKLRVPSSWRSAIRPEQEFQPYDLFNYPEHWNQAQSGVVRRTFTAGHKPGERCFLVLNGVMQRFVVFVNGREVAASQESFLPVEVDVTEALVMETENDLRIWCGPYETVEKPYGNKVLTPSGSWFAGMCRGIWQDIFLEFRPALYLQDSWVHTSVRQQKLEVKAEIYQTGSYPQKVSVRARVYTGQKCVLELESGVLEACPGRACPGQPLEVGLESAWVNPRLWSPEHPDLYDLAVELEVDGKVIDRIQKRFGFREVWLEQNRFFLNGTRLNLRGDAWHYQGFVQQTKEFALNWYRACRDVGVNIVRLHAMPYPEFYLDAADEAGMLIIDESAIYGSGKAMQADHPDFIENCRQHLGRLVRRDRSHPSVVIWSMQNEMRWVDGRDGYKEAMRDLTRCIKALDPTRPVSYDGDNRLVDPEDMEIVSMHYNIDGTVRSWQKDKPLIFGEHGPWHYVSPQVCADLVGPAAYLSYESCQESMGWNEALFNEYARKEQVTGLTPFNIVNYNMWSFPAEEQALYWNDLTTPGVKPCKIPAHSLTIHNGLVDGGPLYNPNPSWKYLEASFKPVTIFRDEYEQSFFGGRSLRRSFSIYNDTEKAAAACLEFTFLDEQERVLDSGKVEFEHLPGERMEWAHEFNLPEVTQRSSVRLLLDLYHSNSRVHHLDVRYQVFPSQEVKIETAGRRIVLFGGQDSYDAVAPVADSVDWKPQIDRQSLVGAEVVIVGKDYGTIPRGMLVELEQFVAAGGYLILLEQSGLTLGDTSLSGKRFFSAFMTDPAHPIFSGLTNEDLRFWSPENIYSGDAGWLVQNAFHKPADGGSSILLECGEGNFGWGGLLWTPLVEVAVGQGRVLLNQLELVKNSNQVPQAQLLLKNMLQYALTRTARQRRETWLIANPDSEAVSFLHTLGIRIDQVACQAPSPGSLQAPPLFMVDPGSLDGANACALRNLVESGAQVLLFPGRPEHAGVISQLAGAPVGLESAEVYQVQALADTATRGISASDLFWIDKVTYSPASLRNTPICDHSLAVQGAAVLLASVHNPWHDYFIRGLDAEFQKVAIATLNAQADFQPQVFGACAQIGMGKLYFSQVRATADHPKSIRFYSRLLGNLGAIFERKFLSIEKTPQDLDIPNWMALEQADYVDQEAMLAYFSAEDFTLNNLGEGVYGWMMRLQKSQAGLEKTQAGLEKTQAGLEKTQAGLEKTQAGLEKTQAGVQKSHGEVRIPGSAGKTWFLTVFVESAENHNPLKRAANELPDSSIVPDLYVKTNCVFSLYMNGKLLADEGAPAEPVKIEDVLLDKGINRLLIVCRAGVDDIRLNAWFRSKYGDPVSGLRYLLTLD